MQHCNMQASFWIRAVNCLIGVVILLINWLIDTQSEYVYTPLIWAILSPSYCTGWVTLVWSVGHAITGTTKGQFSTLKLDKSFRNLIHFISTGLGGFPRISLPSRIYGEMPIWRDTLRDQEGCLRRSYCYSDVTTREWGFRDGRMNTCPALVLLDQFLCRSLWIVSNMRWRLVNRWYTMGNEAGSRVRFLRSASTSFQKLRWIPMLSSYLEEDK